jgi:hypothetical protein
MLASIPAEDPAGRLNEHLGHPDGLALFQHACQMGLDGIVSKRLGSRYRPLAGLAEGQESGSTGSQAGGGRGLGKMREGSSCPDSEPFDALDPSNTGSAKNTPKSDMAMLTRKQHLAVSFQ